MHTGKAFWEDYTFTTAVQPGADGAAGVMVNMPDTAQRLPGALEPGQRSRRAGRSPLPAQNRRRESTTIAEVRGGYIPGQWYKLAVVATLDKLQVLVDGRSA